MKILYAERTAWSQRVPTSSQPSLAVSRADIRPSLLLLETPESQGETLTPPRHTADFPLGAEGLHVAHPHHKISGADYVLTLDPVCER